MTFVDEDSLSSFEGWMKYQAASIEALTPDQVESWRKIFDWIQARAATIPTVGALSFGPGTQYAVAIDDGEGLWLTLCVKRIHRGEIFVLYPHGKHGGDAHLSYHIDGTIHFKSDGLKHGRKSAQPLDAKFQGVEHLGSFAGHAPRGVGAVCDPDLFAGVVRVPRGVLGPRHGQVNVDVLAPGESVPPTHSSLPGIRVVTQSVFQDAVPWISITVLETVEEAGLQQA